MCAYGQNRKEKKTKTEETSRDKPVVLSLKNTLESQGRSSVLSVLGLHLQDYELVGLQWSRDNPKGFLYVAEIENH